MLQLRSIPLLLAGLLLVGWSLSTWLEDGAPWNEPISTKSADDEDAIDVRRLIAAQATQTATALNLPEAPATPQHRDDIELAGGALPDEPARSTTPAWLTGKIE